MSDLTATIDTYLDAYGEPDATRRAKLIEQVWAAVESGTCPAFPISSISSASSGSAARTCAPAEERDAIRAAHAAATRMRESVAMRPPSAGLQSNPSCAAQPWLTAFDECVEAPETGEVNPEPVADNGRVLAVGPRPDEPSGRYVSIPQQEAERYIGHERIERLVDSMDSLEAAEREAEGGKSTSRWGRPKHASAPRAPNTTRWP